MLYTLFKGKQASKSIMIGPMQNCGYVPLINDLAEKNNCASVTAVVNKRIRIIIYTTKKIKKG